MYLVVGANGFLGSYMLKRILQDTDDFIIATSRNIDKVNKSEKIEWFPCDIADKSSVDILCTKIAKYKDKKIIFLAAYHNPDLVSKNPRIAWNINITALSYFINKIDDVKCLYYPSTDSVYGDSVNGYHYKEKDALNPVNTYGRQKVIAEQLILGYGYNVVRFPFLIAPSLSPVKKHFYDKIVDDLKQRRQVEMFSDSLRSSLSFDTAAYYLVQLVEQECAPKILNICGDKDYSKYDIGCMIADKVGVSRNLIVPIKVSSHQNIFDSPRAKSTLMDNSKLKETLHLKHINLII